MKKLSVFMLSVITMFVLAVTCFTCTAVTVENVDNVKTATRPTYAVLSWDKSEGAQGYGVFMYDSTAKKYISLAVVKSTYIRIEELTPGKNYVFAIRAYAKQSGKTVWSALLSKAVVATRPECVSVIKAASTETSVTISWNKSAGATGYRIFKYNPANKTWDIAVKATSQQKATFKFLNQGKNYIYAVRPYFNTGTSVVWSTSQTQVLTSTLPPKVIGVRVDSTIDSASLTWSASSGATKYYIYQYDSAAKAYKAIASTTKNQYKITGLEINKNYYFLVRAVKSVTANGKTTHYWGAYSDKIKVHTAVDPSYWGEQYTAVINQYNSSYSVMDINNDNIPELFVRYGTCAADEVFKVYTMKNSKAYYMGSVSAGAYVAPTTTGNGFYSVFVKTGAEIVSYYTANDVDGHDNAKGKRIYSSAYETESDVLTLTKAKEYDKTDISGLFWYGNPKNTNDEKIKNGKGTYFGY